MVLTGQPGCYWDEVRVSFVRCFLGRLVLSSPQLLALVLVRA